MQTARRTRGNPRILPDGPCCIIGCTKRVPKQRWRSVGNPELCRFLQLPAWVVNLRGPVVCVRHYSLWTKNRRNVRIQFDVHAFLTAPAQRGWLRAHRAVLLDLLHKAGETVSESEFDKYCKRQLTTRPDDMSRVFCAAAVDAYARELVWTLPSGEVPCGV